MSPPSDRLRRAIEVSLAAGNEILPAEAFEALMQAAPGAAVDDDRRPPPNPHSEFQPTNKRLEPRIVSNREELKVRPVPRDHKHAPAPKKFNVVNGVLYVLLEDWPALRDAIDRRRGLLPAQDEQ